MDPADVEVALERLISATVPPSGVSEARTLFGLRNATDELAEPIGAEVSATDASGSSVRTIVFASETRQVVVAIDDDARQILGHVTPPKPVSVWLTSVVGRTLETRTDDVGFFTLAEVPTGRVQFVIGGGEGGVTLRTAWTPLIDRTAREPVRPRATFLGDDELVRRRLTRQAIAPAPGRLDPPGPFVARTLAPAAQHETRALPLQRWVSDRLGLEVVLAETSDERLTITVTGAADLPDDVIVAVRWSTVATDGGTREDQIVTAMPVESSRPRLSTYDVGPSQDVSAFGLGDVALLPTSAIGPMDVADALARRPYGNAVRAWDVLISQLGDNAMREAFVVALGEGRR